MGLKNLKIINKELMVNLSWHPRKELALNEYLDMVTYYVQNYIEKQNAERIPTEAISFGPQQDSEDSERFNYRIQRG
jgi:hypothetical protein